MTIVRIIDFETTGDKPENGVVIEVGTVDLHIEDKRIDPPASYLCYAETISPETRAIHHISLPMVQEKGVAWFDAEALNYEAAVDQVSCWAAHNSAFESSFFAHEKPIICTYKSALRAWPEAPSHSNGALFYWLQDEGRIPADVDMSLCLPAHRAGPDAYVTAWIMLALLDAGFTGRQMVAWTKEPPLLPRCPIGKFRNKPWAEVEMGFLGWMIKQADMDVNLKWNAQREIDRRNV